MEPFTLTDLLVLVVSALLIISKFFDCITTHKNIELGEGNPFAGPLMDRYGSGTVIWSIFLFVLLVVIASAAYYFLYPNILYGISYIILGMVISAFQFAAAHHNYNRGRGRIVSNVFIRLMEKLHTGLKK